jgi:hypothetical protein
VTTELTDAVEQFDGVSLEGLDERAALLRRVDNKYAVQWEGFLELLEHLRADHDILDIDGRREFAYRSTYFDSPDLRCFTDHVEDRHPRFKARTRLYLDSGTCVFEIKLKRGEGETDKRQIDHPTEDAERLTDSARECVNEALNDAHLNAPERMAPTLQTSFHRITLAARDTPERITCDLGVELALPGGDAVRMRDGLVLVETKTEEGDSEAGRALESVGAEPISLSKYRVGMSLVGGGDRSPQPGSDLFE